MKNVGNTHKNEEVGYISVFSKKVLQGGFKNMMEKQSKGGLINIQSFIDPQEKRTAADRIMTSNNIRYALKEGKQDLYANPEDVFKKYKNFDIAKQMQELKGGNFLWVRARAIDADVVNANGDYFSEEELLKDFVDQQGNKIPAYKTFEGVPIYTNHENSDITKAKGQVVYAEWDEKEKCVWCTFYIDADAYPEVARGIRVGYMKDVSMGCFLPGTRVLTSKGYKNIENVDPNNDLLLDKDGNFTKIVNKQIRVKSEDIYEITFNGGNKIFTTCEHPHFAYTREQWLSRKKRDKRGKGKERWSYSDIGAPLEILSQDLKVGDYFVTPLNQIELNPQNIDARMARLIGYFLAEGNFMKYHGELTEIEFTFSLAEKYTLVEEVVKLLGESFPGSNVKVYDREPTNNCVIRVYGREIANHFYNLCGQYSDSKKLHHTLMYLPKDLQLEILKAYFNGDGGLHKVNGKVKGISASTCSLDLAEQLSMMLYRNGIFHKKSGMINGSYVGYEDAKIAWKQKGELRKTFYTIDIPASYSKAFSSELKFSIEFDGRFDNYHSENWVVHPIKSIEKRPYEGLVYNFETESNTYIVDNYATHNCQVQSGECSVCGNIAHTEKEYCEHLKKHKGKTNNGVKVYEKNFDLKFIELSVVGDGAFDSCEIEEIYDVDEIIVMALDLEKKAQTIRDHVSVAASAEIQNPIERLAYEDCLREALSCANQTTRLSQVAGTLVGGPLMAGNGANSNSTINHILTALGINATESLRVLDMLNLALNFAEVAVMNMFARKENIDLGYVEKITKAMAQIQSTMGDMIDDGVDSSAPSGGAPLNQPQMQQASPMQPGPNQAPENYTPVDSGVGRVMGPQAAQTPPPTQTQSFMLPNGIGGGIMANTKNKKLVWAHDGEEVRTITASNMSQKSNSNIEKLTKDIYNLAEIISLNNRSAEKNNSTPYREATTGNNNMDLFKKWASEQQKQAAAKVTVDFKVSNNNNRIVLSSDGSITAFHEGQKVAWNPKITNEHYTKIANGLGDEVAADLLDDFSNAVTAAKNNGRNILAEWKVDSETDKTWEEKLDKVRTGEPGLDNQETLLGDKAGRYNRTNDEKNVIEKQLDKSERGSANENHYVTNQENMLDGGLYGRKGADDDVRELLLNDARLGNPSEVIELQLNDVRKTYGPGTPNLSVKCAVNALAKAVIAAKVAPDEVVEAAWKLAQKEDLADLIKLSSLGKTHREKLAARAQFHKLASINLDAESALLEALGNEVNNEIFAANLAKAIKFASNDTGLTLKTVTKRAQELMGDTSVEATTIKKSVSEEDLYRAALAAQADDQNEALVSHARAVLQAFAETVNECKIAPKELVASFNDVDLESLTTDIEIARTASAVESRSTQREREAFWNNNVRVASKTDIRERAIGWLADYCIGLNFSTAAIADATLKIAQKPTAAENLIGRLVKAAIKVTDEEVTTRRIQCTIGDLGGIDPKSEDFKDQFRQKAIEILSSNGYNVDPTTFALSDVDVTATGDITASVTSRFSKSFDATTPTSDSSMMGDLSNTEGMNPEVTVTTQPSGGLITASALQARKARRQSILREAQFGGPMMGGGAPMGGTMPMNDPMAGGMDPSGPGVSSFTGADPNAAPADPNAAPADPNADPNAALAEKPEVKAPGEICIRCGSNNVDVTGGRCNCKDCGANFTITINYGLEPDSEAKPGDAMAEDPMGTEDPMGAMAEGGLGGATAPQPNADPMGGGAAPMMMQASYLEDPDIFVRFAQEEYTRSTRVASLDSDRKESVPTPLPIGLVCPGCGNRQANKIRNKTFCHQCGTVAMSNVEPDKKDPTKVLASIKWIV